MEHQKLGKVSQADADRAAAEYKLPGFDLACVPADHETDEFVQACKAVNAAPGTRIAQVSPKVVKMVNAKKNSRAKLQKKVTAHYQQMGILAGNENACAGPNRGRETVKRFPRGKHLTKHLTNPADPRAARVS